MEHKDEKIVVVCIIILIFLLANFAVGIKTCKDYNKGKKSGNERWNQVEERIIKLEKEVDSLKVEVQQWRN